MSSGVGEQAAAWTLRRLTKGPWRAVGEQAARSANYTSATVLMITEYSTVLYEKVV